ncbi:hypothetical protein ACFX15_043231 [Malus domestica]
MIDENARLGPPLEQSGMYVFHSTRIVYYPIMEISGMSTIPIHETTSEPSWFNLEGHINLRRGRKFQKDWAGRIVGPLRSGVRITKDRLGIWQGTIQGLPVQEGPCHVSMLQTTVPSKVKGSWWLSRVCQ